MNAFTGIPEAALKPEPLFFVEPKDRNPASEIERQATFRKLMRQLAPTVMVYATPNAAKRGLKAQRDAKREGMRSGVFDTTIVWPGDTAWIEFKNGTASIKDSPNQIEFGNDLVALGKHCAVFRDPANAVDWLRDRGCPIRPDLNRAHRHVGI